MERPSPKRPSRSSSTRAVVAARDRRSRSRRIVDSAGDKVFNIIQRDYDQARLMMCAAIRSQAYLYPLKGISYFFTHPELRRPFLSQLWPYATLNIIVTTSMFILTFLPQLAVLMFLSGPLAVFMTVLLVLNESSVIINFVSRVWLLRNGLLDTFDATLISRNQIKIVSEGRAIRQGGDAMDRLGRVIKSPFQNLSLDDMIRHLLYLPLNLIPLFGTFAYLTIQGRARGRACHDRYFQLKNWSYSQRTSWLETHAAPYLSFGIVAAMAELTPVASMLFAYTNTVGAALWAADLEDHTSAMTRETTPHLRQIAETAAKEQ